MIALGNQIHVIIAGDCIQTFRSLLCSWGCPSPGNEVHPVLLWKGNASLGPVAQTSKRAECSALTQCPWKLFLCFHPPLPQTPLPAWECTQWGTQTCLFINMKWCLCTDLHNFLITQMWTQKSCCTAILQLQLYNSLSQQYLQYALTPSSNSSFTI